MTAGFFFSHSKKTLHLWYWIFGLEIQFQQHSVFLQGWAYRPNILSEPPSADSWAFSRTTVPCSTDDFFMVTAPHSPEQHMTSSKPNILSVTGQLKMFKQGFHPILKPITSPSFCFFWFHGACRCPSLGRAVRAQGVASLFGPWLAPGCVAA